MQLRCQQHRGSPQLRAQRGEAIASGLLPAVLAPGGRRHQHGHDDGVHEVLVQHGVPGLEAQILPVEELPLRNHLVEPAAQLVRLGVAATQRRDGLRVAHHPGPGVAVARALGLQPRRDAPVHRRDHVFHKAAAQHDDEGDGRVGQPDLPHDERAEAE